MSRWPIKPLGEVAETALGKMLDKGRPRGLPRVRYLRNVNVQWGRIDTGDLLTMELADDQRERFAVAEGDLLVCEGGEIGKCAIWQGSPEYVAYQKALHRIRPSELLDSKYLRYLLEHHAQNGTLERLATGSTIAHLPQQQLRRVPVPLPPLGEQRRIVAILEDHLSRLGAAQAGLKVALTRLGKLREAALAAAVEDAKASEGVEFHRLGDLATIGSGMTPLRGNKAFYEGGTIPWITSGDLHQGLVTQARNFVTQAALEQTSLRMIPAGALLIAMYGEGKTRGTAAELLIDATTNQACASVILHDPTLRPWVRLVLDANYVGLRRLASGGVQPNLNLSLVKAIGVPVPPTARREALVRRVAQIDDSVMLLQSELRAAAQRGSLLQRSLLSAAFSGRLTGSSGELSVVGEMIDA